MSYDMQYAEKNTMFLINQMWNIDYVRLFWATEPEWIDLKDTHWNLYHRLHHFCGISIKEVKTHSLTLSKA